MSTHNLCFQAEIRKNNIYPGKPQFYYLKEGFKGDDYSFLISPSLGASEGCAL